MPGDWDDKGGEVDFVVGLRERKMILLDLDLNFPFYACGNVCFDWV